jgi:type IV pilus assembly protein PilM
MQTGLDIGSYSVKVIQIEKSFGKTIKLVGAARQGIKDGFKDHNVGDGDFYLPASRQIFYLNNILAKNCIIGIGGKELNLRVNLVAPIKDTVKLNKIVEYDISEIAGGNISDLYYDFLPLNFYQNDYTEKPLLLGIAKKGHIDSRVKLLNDIGIPVIDVLPDPIALWHGCNQIHDKAFWKETVIILDVGASNINIIISQNGNLIFARNVAGGGRYFTETIKNTVGCSWEKAEDAKINEVDITVDKSDRTSIYNNAVLSAMGQVHGIIENSLAFCKTQLKRDITIDRVLISGGGAKIKGFANRLSSLINRPVDFFNPFINMDFSLLSQEVRTKMLEVPSDMVISLGLALRIEGHRRQISLLPTGIKKKIKFYQETIYGVCALILLSLSLFFFIGNSFVRRQKILTEKQNVTPKYEKIKKAEKQFEEAFARKEKLESEYNEYVAELENNIFFAKGILVISKFVPSGARISDITLGRFYQDSKGYKKQYEGDVIAVKGYLIDETVLKQLDNFYQNIINNNIYPMRIVPEERKLTPILETSPKGKYEFEFAIRKSSK